MFDALKGLKQAIAAKERTPEPRRELAPDAAEKLNRSLLSLEKGQLATLVFYDDMQHEYRQLTGFISKIDPTWRYIQVGAESVRFGDLYQATAQVFDTPTVTT